MIFYCSTCDTFHDEDEVGVVSDNLTDVPCPDCSMPMNMVGENEPYDTLGEKYL